MAGNTGNSNYSHPPQFYNNFNNNLFQKPVIITGSNPGYGIPNQNINNPDHNNNANNMNNQNNAKDVMFSSQLPQEYQYQYQNGYNHPNNENTPNNQNTMAYYSTINNNNNNPSNPNYPNNNTNSFNNNPYINNNNNNPYNNLNIKPITGFNPLMFSQLNAQVPFNFQNFPNYNQPIDNINHNNNENAFFNTDDKSSNRNIKQLSNSNNSIGSNSNKYISYLNLFYFRQFNYPQKNQSNIPSNIPSIFINDDKLTKKNIGTYSYSLLLINLLRYR